LGALLRHRRSSHRNHRAGTVSSRDEPCAGTSPSGDSFPTLALHGDPRIQGIVALHRLRTSRCSSRGASIAGPPRSDSPAVSSLTRRSRDRRSPGRSEAGVVLHQAGAFVFRSRLAIVPISPLQGVVVDFSGSA
jgi:hypothetical protein